MNPQLAKKPAILDWMSSAEKTFRTDFPKIIDKLPLVSFLDLKSFVVDGYFVGPNVGSVVCRVRDKNGVYIVKSKSDPKSLRAEVLFLCRWHEVGARVVKVLELIETSGDFDLTVAILEYVPSETTEQELLKSKKDKIHVYEKLGRGLAIMHRAKGKGFGEIMNLKLFKGRYQTFQEEIRSIITPQKQELLLVNKLIKMEDVRLLASAIEIVENDIRQGTKPSLIHDDPGIHNTFGTKSIKFFDPDPKISHPLMDLATALIWGGLGAGDKKGVFAALIKGYRSESKYDELALQACLFLKILEKWQWWLHRGKSEEHALGWIKKTKILFANAKKQFIFKIQ